MKKPLENKASAQVQAAVEKQARVKAHQLDLFRSSRRDVCFVDLGDTPKALAYFSDKYNIPVIDRRGNIAPYKTVLFSMHSWRDFYTLARIANRKAAGQEWLAGGNALTNPTGIAWALDYAFIGDAFYTFPKILAGERDLPGMFNCKTREPVTFNEEPIFHEPYIYNEMMLSVGCRRRCAFCVLPWKRGYQEANADKVVDLIQRAPGRAVGLNSSSSDDVTFYDDRVVPALRKYGKDNKIVSNSIGGITVDFLEGRRTEILVGVEGVSERLRRVVNKPISRDRLLTVLRQCFDRRLRIRTVYQFNLPSEQPSDFDELYSIIDMMRREYAGKPATWKIPFIPNHPSAHSPMQWSDPQYSVEKFERLIALRTSMIGSGKGGLTVYIPFPLGPLGWFQQLVAEWVPITPAICKAIGSKTREPIAAYVDKLKQIGVDLSHVWGHKPKDFAFPWDVVKIRSSRDELWLHYSRMMRRAGLPVTGSEGG